MKIILLILTLIAGIFAWACCMAAATADDQAEELYQDYLRYKKRKEEEANGRKED